MRRRALVTGANGFIGRYLVHELADHGWLVRALCGRKENVPFCETRAIETTVGDILRIDSLRRAVAGCTHVFHLAAQTNVPAFAVKSVRLNNVVGTENVMRVSLEANVERVVYRSSTGVYGRIHSGPATLDAPIKPDTPYRESKWLGEKVVHAYQRKGLPAVVARVSTAYGPGSNNRLHIFKDILTGNFRMYGKGENRDHPVFATDLATGIRRCAEIDGIEGRTYILAGKEALPVSEEVKIMARYLGVKPAQRAYPLWPLNLLQAFCDTSFRISGRDLGLVERLAFFLSDRYFDNTVARRELGYEPEVGLREGLERTGQWYRELGFISS